MAYNFKDKNGSKFEKKVVIFSVVLIFALLIIMIK